MPATNWLSLLTDQIRMSEAFRVELDRQLRAHARQLAGVELDDGYHALMPPDSGFATQLRTLGSATVGAIEGELVAPDAHAYPVVLAWRSTGEANEPPGPDMDPQGNVEFFWAEFPIAELAGPGKADMNGWQTRIAPSFAMEWDLHAEPDVWLQLTAHEVFSPADVDALTQAMDAAIAEWNENQTSKIHYRGAAEVGPGRSTLAVYLDLGSGGSEALAALIRALDTSPAARAIARCVAGRQRHPGETTSG